MQNFSQYCTNFLSKYANFLAMARKKLIIFLAGTSRQEKNDFLTREIFAKHQTVSPYPANGVSGKKTPGLSAVSIAS